MFSRISFNISVLILHDPPGGCSTASFQKGLRLYIVASSVMHIHTRTGKTWSTTLQLAGTDEDGKTKKFESYWGYETAWESQGMLRCRVRGDN